MAMTMKASGRGRPSRNGTRPVGAASAAMNSGPRPLLRYFMLFSLLFLPFFAQAGQPVERLDRFLRDVHSFSAYFGQVVTDADGQVLQTASGRVDLARPGRFRWDYNEPFHQIILADGQSLWVYDVDLEQVMVRNMDETLGAAPIMLLSGHRSVSEDFTLREAGTREGLDWVALEPKNDQSDFGVIELGIGGEGIDTMVLHDRLGQKTWIRFTGMVLNPEFPPGTFQFEVPPGVDVIRN